MPSLSQQVANHTTSRANAKWLWRNRGIKLIDGTTLSMADSAANQAAYPQPDSQKTGVGFPIARVVGIMSLAVGSLLDVAIGRYARKETGEHALLRQLLANFKQGDIVIGDAYYPSFFLVSALQKMGVDVLFPQHNARKTDGRRGR